MYNTPQFDELVTYQGNYDDHFGHENAISIHRFDPKLHTIRQGKKHKVGDRIKPMVWAGRPYNKTVEGLWKIQFAPPLELVEVYDFELKDGLFFINNELYAYNSSIEALDKLAMNDGLFQGDLLEWFRYPKDFSGQIICWGHAKY